MENKKIAIIGGTLGLTCALNELIANKQLENDVEIIDINDKNIIEEKLKSSLEKFEPKIPITAPEIPYLEVPFDGTKKHKPNTFANEFKEALRQKRLNKNK